MRERYPHKHNGAVVGLVAWMVVVPGLETAVGHRIAPSHVPWWHIVAAMALAVVCGDRGGLVASAVCRSRSDHVGTMSLMLGVLLLSPVTIRVAATRRIRRSHSAATAGGLALLGALIGAASAVLAMAAIHARDFGALFPVPGLHLVLIGIDVPLAAAAAGRLFRTRTDGDRPSPIQ